MSTVKLNSSSGGSVALTPPTTASDYTQTLVPQTGTLAPLVSGTSVSASGTSVDFTSIPSWVKRITVIFSGVSTSGTSPMYVRIGTGGTVQASGYLGTAIIVAASPVSAQLSTGLNLDANGGSAAYVKQGFLTFNLMTGNTWSFGGTVGQSDSNRSNMVSGTVALSGALDILRVTTFNGTDTFDAGSINILYE